MAWKSRIRNRARHKSNIIANRIASVPPRAICAETAHKVEPTPKQDSILQMATNCMAAHCSAGGIGFTFATVPA